MDNFRVLKAKEEDWEEAMGLAFRTFRKYVEPDYPKEGADNFIDFISDPHLFNMFRIGDSNDVFAIGRAPNQRQTRKKCRYKQ